jgi:hypothetical protein
VRLDDLQDARTEPLPRLRRRRGTAELRDTESVAHVLLDRRRKAQEIALEDPTQCSGFSSAARTRRTSDYPSFGYQASRSIQVLALENRFDERLVAGTGGLSAIARNLRPGFGTPESSTSEGRTKIDVKTV